VAGTARLRLTYLSKDQEEAIPANLAVTVTYTWTIARAKESTTVPPRTRRPFLNLTNHAYFNLAGAGSCDISQTRTEITRCILPPLIPPLFPLGSA